MKEGLPLDDIVDFISYVDCLILLYYLLECIQVSLNNCTDYHIVGVEGSLMSTLGEGISLGNFSLYNITF